LLHFSPLAYDERNHKNPEQKKRSRLVEVQVSGENQDDHHGLKHTRTNPGFLLEYRMHKDYRNEFGRKLEITLEKDGLSVISHIQFYDGIMVISSWTEIKNNSSREKGLEYVSSFALTGIEKEGNRSWEKKCLLYIPHNTWCGELQWRKYTLPELGLNPVNKWSSLKRVSIGSTGTWSTAEYLPMGCFQNTDSELTLLWQIEHNGSWHWEVSDQAGHLYLQLSGPSEIEGGWFKKLKPGESFITVPAAVAMVFGGFEKAAREMTKYRRRIRRSNEDNINLPVIFNDFANCLNGDPTTEKLIPLIDAAAKIGCEYFCIDAGWYSDGEWWDGVGEWKPSNIRFPKGIKEPLGYIKSKGMIPGLWLEIEVMGINCPLAKILPDDWFFTRHGRRVIDHSRYQLDFRNPEVRKYADNVVKRLVTEYGAGYIKMDYNINAGIGTETNSDSFGDGLLEHNRAYISWLKGLFEKYPGLVIENCGSGGMRMDYAMLKQYSIQSISDQSHYEKNALISAAAPTALTPEQSAVWSYPLKNADKEEVVFNMVNAMLQRVHQSGNITELSEESLQLVKEGIECYKNIRKDIPSGLPFWPLGLPCFSDEWTALGISLNNKAYIAVWRIKGDKSTCLLPVREYAGRKAKARCIYPSYENCRYEWNSADGIFKAELPQVNCARLFELIF
jgi:alpha-galactosidase